ncbi:DUF4367 domain-containing protein [Natranaerobius trueperi]|uniref:DUF4367 domain-containing protein n=1 Tax=Natranaerobius trueperi TaxID=759412 RepID=A0A226BVG4_9FIRM|nr:DUF4367 domain-containing protein [Natranaerobius trueperi]OWZ82752.1 hypothetical protein CDO51_12435 [Natranaerobius trueperi]
MTEQDNFEKLLADIERHRGKKKLNKVGKTLVSIVVFFVIINSFGFFDNQITALRSTFFEIISQEGSQVQYGWLSEELDEELKIDKLILPNYLPSGYELDEWDIEDETLENYRVTLFFSDGDKKIRLIQRKINEGTHLSAGFGEASTETTEINGEKGIIAFHENDYITVSFIDYRGIEHAIMGQITKNELLKIAESLN